MTGFLQDVGYSIRLLRRAPGFTVVALATLALGIGVSTAIFTIVDSVLLRPLPFPEPKRLVDDPTNVGFSPLDGVLHDWRLEGRTFSDMAGWHDVHVNVTGGGVPLDVLADRVTPNFFAVSGTPPQLGRTFRYAADLIDVEPEVILSQGFWQRRYGGDPTVIGQSITLDGESFTIVAVMPEGYTIRTTELSESHAELWIPFALRPGNSIGMGGNLHVVGRLAPTATPDQAQIELSLIARRIEQTYPSYSRDWGVEVIPLLDATVKDVHLVILVLFGAVAVLLAIACANVANLVTEPRRETPHRAGDQALARRDTRTARAPVSDRKSRSDHARRGPRHAAGPVGNPIPCLGASRGPRPSSHQRDRRGSEDSVFRLSCDDAECDPLRAGQLVALVAAIGTP